MLLTNPFPGAFGLDIGDLSIKLVRLRLEHHLRRGPTFSVDAIRTVRLPPGLIVNGEIQQPELVRKKILYLIGREGAQKAIHSPWVVAGLPEPKTFLKLIEIDAPAAEIMAEDVAFNARKHLPFELEETYLDWQVIPTDAASGGGPARVLVAAVPKVIADNYTYLLEAAGLAPVALEAESVALARALITRDKDYTGMARAILDIGATRSSLIIYDHDSIQVSTALPFSGELLTTAIAQGLKIDYASAEKLKLKNGLRHDTGRPLYLKLVSDAMTALIADIKKALVFYKEHFADANPITHITLCGGGARIAGGAEILSQKLGIATQPGNVWKNLLLGSTTAEDRDQGLSLAPVVGLALRAATFTAHG